MSLIRRNTHDPFDIFDETMNRMLERMRSMIPFDDELVRTDTSIPAIDMVSDENSIVVRAALPGFKEDEIDVNVHGNLLTITAETHSERQRDDEDRNWHIHEMRYGKFARSITLPEEVKSDKANASLTDGILTITLPKQKPSPVHKIAVKARNLLKGENK